MLQECGGCLRDYRLAERQGDGDEHRAYALGLAAPAVRPRRVGAPVGGFRGRDAQSEYAGGVACDLKR